eukprot:953988-Rhodomonas_salina.1
MVPHPHPPEGYGGGGDGNPYIKPMPQRPGPMPGYPGTLSAYARATQSPVLRRYLVIGVLLLYGYDFNGCTAGTTRARSRRCAVLRQPQGTWAAQVRAVWAAQ